MFSTKSIKKKEQQKSILNRDIERVDFYNDLKDAWMTLDPIRKISIGIKEGAQGYTLAHNTFGYFKLMKCKLEQKNESTGFWNVLKHMIKYPYKGLFKKDGE